MTKWRIPPVVANYGNLNSYSDFMQEASLLLFLYLFPLFFILLLQRGFDRFGFVECITLVLEQFWRRCVIGSRAACAEQQDCAQKNSGAISHGDLPGCRANKVGLEVVQRRRYAEPRLGSVCHFAAGWQ
jgi:hypothetical protein